MYAIVDVETTGGKYNEEGITEIAIYRFDGFQVTDSLISLINPERPIQPFVEHLTSITNTMVKRAPKFHQLAKRILEITKNAIIIAHNATFDYRMLSLEYKRLGYEYQRDIICTVELSKKLIPNQPSYSLGKLAKSLGIAVSNRHRADGDAQITLKLFKILLYKDSQKIILQHSEKPPSKKNLATQHIKIVENLPNTSGIYYIHNTSSDIIYINKTSNIKTEVSQHLVSNEALDCLIQDFLGSVSYEKTSNNLIATLKMNEEVRFFSPFLNTQKQQSNFAKSTFSYPAKNIAIIDCGRAVDERSVVLIKNGKLKGYGYYNLNHQLRIDILENIITPVEDTKENTYAVEKYLKNSLALKIVSF